jgi:deoxyribodipyrimidine photolyase-related protein
VGKTVFVIFPHQLFKDIELLHQKVVILVEEHLFFTQFKFHKQKLALHRASMMAYAGYLHEAKIKCAYVESTTPEHDVRALIKKMAQDGYDRIEWYNTCDHWLERRITTSVSALGLNFLRHESPLFLDSENWTLEYKPEAKKFFQTEYYIQQRKKFKILLEGSDRPVGGKWSFDADNRKKYPARQTPPSTEFCVENKHHKEARKYVQKCFTDNPGSLDSAFLYPVTFQETEDWFRDFLKQRFLEFGEYEDAILSKEHTLHHAVITPMLNIGLITPKQIVQWTLDYAEKHDIPMNSLEGFIRQVIGWREFIRLIYIRKGSDQRTKNFWGFKRKIPASFYNGTTGILPVDQTIRKLLKTGYNHHIERLMVLSNFMLLCEFDPDEVYRWFMEMYIDSYDWVMVPNVYGMGQFADGGLMCTKPYISGSNYIFKMSDYPKGGDWVEIWDALFWRFMHVHRDFFSKNPRLNMLVKTFEKWPAEKKNHLLDKAENYLNTL